MPVNATFGSVVNATGQPCTKHVRELCDIAIRDGVKQRDHLDNE